MTWRRVLILDLALLAVLLAGARRIRRAWYDFEANHRVEAIRAEAEPARTIPAAVSVPTTAEDWTDISVKNPFSFDRNDVAIITPKQAAPPQPKPILFGTMSVGKEWIAMLAPGQAGNRASRPVKVGESLGDWQVVEIRDKSVVVAGPNGNRETVIMDDPAAQVARAYERTSAPAPALPAPVNVLTAAPASQPLNAPAAAATPATPAPTPSGQTPQQPRMLSTPFGPVPRTEP